MYLENFMSKDELVKRLRDFSKTNEKSRTLFYEGFLAKILANFLEASDLPTRPDVNILNYLAPVIARGVEDDAKLPSYKQVLDPFTKHCVSSLTALLSLPSEEMSRDETIRDFTRTLELSTGISWLGILLRSYWDAQYNVLWQLADRFNKDIWQKGLYGLVYAHSHRSGRFRATKLQTSNFCGRIGITLDRGDGVLWFRGMEGNPSSLALGAGPEVPLNHAIEMVEEVILLWPSDPEKQARIMKPMTK